MKAVLSILILVSAQAVLAGKTTTFNCEMAKYPKQIITFKMTGLNTPQVDFVQIADYTVFTTKSKDQNVVTTVDTLNGQGGDLRTPADRIEFFGDNAGVDFVYLDLFKKSGYTKGYVRMDFSGEKDYTTISCRLK